MSSSKLKNVKAVRELLNGTHRLQTKKTVGFSDVEYTRDQNKKREIGEVWEEVDATGKTVCWWEQKDGYKVKQHYSPEVSNEFSKIREYLKSFPNCQKETCTCMVPTHLDLKFKKLAGMCHDCLVSYETKLKMQGKFEPYAVDKMRKNAEAFFQDADKEVEVIKEQLKTVSFVNSELGDVEKWSGDNVDGLIENIGNQYETFKANVLGKFSAKQDEDKKR
jgi:hypothetical protein